MAAGLDPANRTLRSMLTDRVVSQAIAAHMPFGTRDYTAIDNYATSRLDMAAP